MNPVNPSLQIRNQVRDIAGSEQAAGNSPLSGGLSVIVTPTSGERTDMYSTPLKSISILVRKVFSLLLRSKS
jgi:hypothetical protein